ncbi:MAG: FKBP-type peptidyl-prolyl cis-trans isomerase [Myxococcales bacterium]|nr:FKBP-type peptidyl-prolyl cis-trans isomerase [Myxococcales bacterium]
MQIINGKRVTVAVKLSLADNGQEIEKKVIEYVQGTGQMLRGFEEAIMGLSAGDEKEGVIPAKDAFGAVENLPTKRLRRNELPGKLEVGQMFEAKDPSGQPIHFRVEKLVDDAIEVRFMHPLATRDIAYHVKVLKVIDRVPPPIPISLDLEAE